MTRAARPEQVREHHQVRGRGAAHSAKDFRTCAGTVRAALALAEFKKYDSHAEAKRNVVAAIESVSKQLGNTPAICRKCYVHPEVLDAYMSGDLVKMIEAKIARKFKRQYAKLTSDEIMVLAFLRKRLVFTEGRCPSPEYQSA
jgi:DNA topoisomerase I